MRAARDGETSVYTIDEAAYALGITRADMRRTLIKNPGYHFEAGKRTWRITAADLERLLYSLSGKEPRWHGKRLLTVTPDAVKPPVSWLYFIQCGEFIKIGITTGIKARLSSIRTTSPFPVTLLHTMRGGRKKERELHNRFADFRHQGEWFRYEGELVEFVEALRAGATA